MFLSVLVIAMFCGANAEFIQTANEQISNKVTSGVMWVRLNHLVFQQSQSNHSLVMSIFYLN